MKRRPRFDRNLDQRVNGAKAEELARFHIPQYWIVVSPVECQALLAGVVSTSIQNQVVQLLQPDLMKVGE